MCGPLLLGIVGGFALELWVLIQVGARVGALETIFLVFLTAAVGMALVRGQSLTTLDRLRRGHAERAEVIEGPLLVVAALLLLLPGFVSDAAGALLLIPPLRRLVARKLFERFGRGGPGGPPSDDTIIVIRR
jgi:UPF0716 protein FxsA